MIFASRFCFLSALLVGCVLASSTSAQDVPAPLVETAALQAMIVEGESGAILFEKASDVGFAPASLAKLMTMEIVFAALESGELSPSTAFTVSEHAWRTGGAPSRTSTMFAEVRSQVPVKALIQGVIVQAANDAAIILAEGMEGSEEAFAIRMNKRAAELGLRDSRFVNPTGLPADGQVVSARDLTRLALHIESTYPDYYRTYAQAEFEWNGIVQRNRNPLLGLDVGATGMGTGFTEGAGYSLVSIAVRDGRKTVMALGGLSSEQERAREAQRLLTWARESFDRISLFKAGDIVATAAVFGGVGGSVPLVVSKDLIAFAPKDRASQVRANVVYDGPLQAPVEKGTRVGRIDILIGDRVSVTQDLVAATDVPVGTFSGRAIGAVQELAFGWIRAL